MGDVNGDGKLDATVVSFGDANVSILLGNGAGGFSPASGSPVAVGGGPDASAIGDLNGDGRLDLAVANFFDNTVTILIGNGAGGFGEATGSPVAVGTLPASVVIGDLNGDGKPDLVTANNNSHNVTILLGNGAGGFSPSTGSPVSVGANPRSVAASDVNGDGRLDLVVSNFTSNNVTILLNQTINAENGTVCDDANECTASDACTGGVCSGTPVPAPAEVDNGVRVTRSGVTATVSWNLAAGATSSAVLRGLESALPVGPGGGDESCLASGIPSTTLTWADAISPAPGASFWYLVRGDNACGKGPYGFEATNGVPTIPRASTTCP